MGVIMCPIHGRQHILLVCEHIKNDFFEGIISEIKIIPIIGTKICTNCFTINNLEEIENLTFEQILNSSKEEQKFFKKFENINQFPLCKVCFNDLKFKTKCLEK